MEKLDNMRVAGEIGNFIFEFSEKMIEPGITTKAISDKIEEIIRSHGATPEFLGYHGFPAPCCISLNEEICHGIPSERELEEGDLISIDLGIRIKDHLVDACRTFEVGEVSEEAQHLNLWTRIALSRAIRRVRCGVQWNDVAGVIESTAKENGYKPIRVLTGHGVGESLHEPPILPNYVCEASNNIVLQERQTICVEPMFSNTDETVTGTDKWTMISADGSLASHWEHCVVVTKDGCDILL